MTSMTTRARTLRTFTATPQPSIPTPAGPSGTRMSAQPTDLPTNLRRSPLPSLTPLGSDSGNNGGDGRPRGEGDDDDPDDGPPTPPTQPTPGTPRPRDDDLGLLLRLLQNASRPTPKPIAKLREPDPFDGSDSRKLRTFLALCQLNFRSNSVAFPDDSAKVNYALSYLKGTALEWFEPAITDFDKEEPWMTEWDEFVRQLKVNFGPPDPVGDAEEGLDMLRMRDNQRIATVSIMLSLTVWQL